MIRLFKALVILVQVLFFSALTFIAVTGGHRHGLTHILVTGYIVSFSGAMVTRSIFRNQKREIEGQ